eukprot:1147927-Pelagomonas_calceolata.AAC.12
MICLSPWSYFLSPIVLSSSYPSLAPLPVSRSSEFLLSFHGSSTYFMLTSSCYYKRQTATTMILSGYSPQCFRSAALAGGYSDVTLPQLLLDGSFKASSLFIVLDASFASVTCLYLKALAKL